MNAPLIMTSSTSTTSTPPPPLFPVSSDQEIFREFFDCWIGQLERGLRPLYAAVGSTSGRRSEEEEAKVSVLVEQVVGHYEYYNRAKAAMARADVLLMFTPTWTSSTDNLFIWAGGFRPSTLFHVLHSKSGLQLESQLEGLMSAGVPLKDLADMSLWQVQGIDRLQRETVRHEREISEEEAAAQELVASSRMVAITHEITETKMRPTENKDGTLPEAAMEADMRQQRETMRKVLAKADALRLDTLKGVLGILRPLQAVHFLIAAFELLLRVHEFGKRTDFAAEVRMAKRSKSALF